VLFDDWIYAVECEVPLDLQARIYEKVLGTDGALELHASLYNAHNGGALELKDSPFCIEKSRKSALKVPSTTSSLSVAICTTVAPHLEHIIVPFIAWYLNLGVSKIYLESQFFSYEKKVHDFIQNGTVEVVSQVLHKKKKNEEKEKNS
jgi:hypothetical protein